MHISRKTNQELVVVTSTIWLSIFLLCATLFCLYRTIVVHGGPPYYVAVGFLGICVLVFCRKETVVFDAGRQQAHWTRRRLFRVASGTIAFGEITGIGVETSCAKNNELVYRLTILTPQRPFPMSDAYAGDGGKCERVKQEILEFLKLDSGELSSADGASLSRGVDDELSVRSLLSQGRRIDAIQLVRGTQKLSLTEATDRVNAILRQMNAAQ